MHAVARSVRFLRGARSDRENPNRYVLQSHDACTTECPAPTARRPALNANLVYSKFLFVTLRREDTRARATLREAGSCIARGFFNDFNATGSSNPPSNETVQFLVAATPPRCNDGLLSAEYVAHVTTKYRPQLGEIEAELERRLGDIAAVRAIDGSIKAPQRPAKAPR